MFEFEAVILPCTGVGWREDVLRFNRRKIIYASVSEMLHDLGWQSLDGRRQD